MSYKGIKYVVLKLILKNQNKNTTNKNKEKKCKKYWDNEKDLKKPNIAAYETFLISYFEKDISNADGAPFNELSRFPSCIRAS